LIKRIIAISNHSFMLGGGEQSFLDLLSNLSESWNVLAIVPGEGELGARLRRAGIRTDVVDLPAIRPWHLLKVSMGLKDYFRLFKEYRPTLVYANGPRAVFYGGIAGNMLKIPVIWHCRIADRDRYLDPLLCRLSTRIIANSQATARRFKPAFQHKVKTVYNGIDLVWLQNGAIKKPDLIQSDWKVILVVARISRWKRHDLALFAFEKIAPSDPKLHLVCVGAEDQLEPRWHDYLMLRTKQSPFSDSIHWIGQVTDVRPWYRSADILLLPSENEPFGRVIVEAMACGVPVVATRSGGAPEIVRHGKDGLLVTAGDVDGIADAMVRILTNSNLRRHLSQSVFKRSEIFNLGTHIGKMTKVFEEIIKT
jgi:glycosyltransferase involved in cell wall biosynthesis